MNTYGLATAMRLPVPTRKYVAPMARPGKIAPEELADDALLVRRLRDGDEGAFMEVVDLYGATMLRVAGMYVRDRAVAEEVVQETWLAVLNGIESFEGRSSFKTWLFRILTNRAKSRGEREGRTIPFTAAAGLADDEPSVDPDRFISPDDPHTPGAWAAPPRAWPQDKILERETLDVIRSTIEMLPDTQREVIRLRDIEGWEPDEVSSLLEISDGNQRVLLHRARSKVRAALEQYMNPELVGGAS